MTATKITPAKLRKAAKGNPLLKAIAEWVITHSSDYDDGARGVFRDLFYGGCEAGTVGHLVYYKDTVSFAKKYNKQILNIAIENAEGMGDANVFAHLAACGGAKNAGTPDQVWNFLAWYGWEEGARRLAESVGYDA